MNDPTPRHSLFRSLYELLKPVPETERREILDEVMTWSGASREGRPSHRTMTPDELITLEETGLLQVGVHTLTHPLLPSLSVAAQRHEITQGRVRLQQILGHAVSDVCYPFGAYTADTVALVRSAAFTFACSVSSAVVDPDTDRFQLPRIHLSDWDGEEFSARLAMLANSQ